MGRIFNKKTETEKRKILRNTATKAEILLWNRLKGRQMKNYKFRRQYSVGKYVIDFYSPQLKLAIEVDGHIHNSQDNIEYDIRRQSEIENFGIKFLRIKDEQVLNTLEEVLFKIEIKIEELRKD